MSTRESDKLLLLREAARLWCFLDSFDGSHYEMLSPEAVTQLVEFRWLVLPKWQRNSSLISSQLDLAAEHMLRYILLDNGTVVGTTYRKLWTMIQQISDDCDLTFQTDPVQPTGSAVCKMQLTDNRVEVGNIITPPNDPVEETTKSLLHIGEHHIDDSNLHLQQYGNDNGTMACHADVVTRTRRGRKRYECTECNGKTFANKTSLDHHSRLHTGERPFPCESCTRTFVSASNRDKHVRRRHTPRSEQPMLPCSICGKTFSERAYLRNHIRNHSLDGDGRAEAAWTDLQTTNRCCSTRVRRTSAPVKSSDCDSSGSAKPTKFSCQVCGREFLYQSLLREHARIHVSERLFQCETCGKTFKRTGDLTVHARFHDERKRHECVDCGRRFTWKNGLVRHRRIHTGERPYLCMECGRAFAGYSNHRKHVKMHERMAAAAAGNDMVVRNDVCE